MAPTPVVSENLGTPEREPLVEHPVTVACSTGEGSRHGARHNGHRVKAMRHTFKRTEDLAKHLPTGAVLLFEMFSPMFTDNGKCSDMNRTITAWFVVLCAAACFFLCFTDSFHDETKTVRYIVATPAGLWVIDGTPPPEPEKIIKYKLKPIDFIHAIVSAAVFVCVALFNQNMMSCFDPVMSQDMRQVLKAVPLVGGLVGSSIFATFPSTRRGLGFPSVVGSSG